MIDNLSDYVIENGVLYKTCPSCQLRCEERVYYKCPEYFGYRGKIIQSQCNKCRGVWRTETKPLEVGNIFKDDINEKYDNNHLQFFYDILSKIKENPIGFKILLNV